MREWPIIIATLSSSLLFAISFSAWNNSITVAPVVYISILALTVLLFILNYHRSSKRKKIIFNFQTVPGVSEILIYVLFSILSSIAILTGFEIFWILSFVSGFVMLVAIDTVYANSDKSYEIRYHNAQVFLTGLQLASFMISEPLPFIFISFIKTLYLLVFKIFRQVRTVQKIFSIVYILYLVFVSYSLFNSISDLYFVKILTLLLIFELGMRIIFYFDFTLSSNSFNLFYEKNKDIDEKEIN